MKIDEAVDVLNSIENVEARHKDGCVFIAVEGRKINWGADWFLCIKDDSTHFDSNRTDYSRMDYPLTLDDLGRAISVVQQLFDTPVKERFPEKKYRLVANPNSLEQAGTYATKYVECIQDSMDSFSFVYGGPTIFSEKELKQIEKLHPNIAPAIEAMKEEIDDDE